jgi:long-chain acyl-CoA synthetase
MLGYNGDKSPCIDEDGWFHSGDIGEIHESGHIKVTGRKDDIIVTSYGKNINPIPIENYLRTKCDDIQDILIIGNSRKYLSAMFSLKAGGCVKSVLKCIDAYNMEVSGDRCEIIHRVMYTKDIFTIEGGEITPSNKVRRFNILEKYRDEIEGMYYNFY